MVTFTTVLDTNSLKPEIEKAIKDWGPAPEGKNTKEWEAFSKKMSNRVRADMQPYVKEQFAFAKEMEALLKMCKDMTGEGLNMSVSIAKEPGATSERIKLMERFNTVEALFKKKLDEAQELRTGLVAHQGFRGDLFEPSKLPSLTTELNELCALFRTNRNLCIDKSDALSKTFKKARDEYAARWKDARRRIEDAEKAGPKGRILDAENELTKLKVVAGDWNNEKSERWAKIRNARERLDIALASSKITTTAIEGLRQGIPKLQDQINIAKASLNTDFKRFEAIQKLLGKELYDDTLLDQKLVKVVEKGFAESRASILEMQSKLSKYYEGKIANAEKKLK